MPRPTRPTDADHCVEQLQRVIGMEIENVVVDQYGNPCLTLVNDSKHITYLVVLRDAEGNGPGYVEVSDPPTEDWADSFTCAACHQEVVSVEAEAHRRNCPGSAL